MQKIKIGRWNLPCIKVDKQASKTFIFIHGFSSSHRFIGEIAEHLSANVLAISLPGAKGFPVKHITINALTKIVRKLVKKTRGEVCLIGHSLGGLLVGRVGQMRKVTKIVYIGSVHPLIGETPLLNGYKKVFNNITNPKLARAVERLGKINIMYLKPFMDKDHSWYTVFTDLIQPKTLARLDYDFQATTSKSQYIVGSYDMVISAKKFEEYVNSIGQSIYKIKGFHSPIRDNPAIVAQILEDKM